MATQEVINEMVNHGNEAMGRGTDSAVTRAVAAERQRCAKIVCPDCAKGVAVDGGEHILETYQGHALWSRTCLAQTILNPLSE